MLSLDWINLSNASRQPRDHVAEINFFLQSYGLVCDLQSDNDYRTKAILVLPG